MSHLIWVQNTIYLEYRRNLKQEFLLIDTALVIAAFSVVLVQPSTS